MTNNNYTCTECGRSMDRPGTCSDCLIVNQPVPQKLLDDLKGKKGKGK